VHNLRGAVFLNRAKLVSRAESGLHTSEKHQFVIESRRLVNPVLEIHACQLIGKPLSGPKKSCNRLWLTLSREIRENKIASGCPTNDLLG